MGILLTDSGRALLARRESYFVIQRYPYLYDLSASPGRQAQKFPDRPARRSAFFRSSKRGILSSKSQHGLVVSYPIRNGITGSVALISAQSVASIDVLKLRG
jgi:hypothetical protein